MDEIRALLARAAPDDGHHATWDALVRLVDALPEHVVGDALAEIDESLARSYANPGSGPLWLEDDERVAPQHWVVPVPRPALLIAREVDLDCDALTLEPEQIAAICESRYGAAINGLALRDGNLEPVLDRLLVSPLVRGVGKLSLFSSNIGGSTGAEKLAAAPALAEVCVLNLAFCSIYEKGVDAILDSPNLPLLSTFYVEANCCDQYGELGPPYWDHLHDRLEARRIEMTFV